MIASEKQPGTQPAGTPCSFPVLHFQPLFADLTSVYLGITIDPSLWQALECRGHEEQCAKKDAAISGPELGRYISEKTERLKKLNAGYPHDLDPDNLLALLQPAVKDALSRVLPRDSSCQVPEPRLLDRSTMDHPHAMAPGDSKTTLTIKLAIRIVDTVPARIAILTATYFRAGSEFTSGIDSPPPETAFPLDLPEPEMKAIVETFVKRIAIRPMPLETFRE